MLNQQSNLGEQANHTPIGPVIDNDLPVTHPVRDIDDLIQIGIEEELEL